MLDVDDIPNAVILERGKSELEIDDQVLEDINQQLQIGDLVYFTIDDWPEKLVLKYSGNGAGRLEEPKTSDLMRAEISLRVDGEPPEAEEPILRRLEGDPEYHRVLATQEKVAKLAAKTKFNVPTSMGTFSFDRFLPDENQIRLRIPPQRDIVLYYPWELKPQVEIKKGLVRLLERVEHYELALTAGRTKFSIWPEMVVGGKEAKGDEIAGTNRIVTYFDRTPPRVENVQILTTDLVEAGDMVEIKVDVEDNKGGVGLDADRELLIFFSKTDMRFPGQLPSKGGILAKPDGNRVYRAPAPALPENSKTRSGLRWGPSDGQSREFQRQL